MHSYKEFHICSFSIMLTYLLVALPHTPSCFNCFHKYIYLYICIFSCISIYISFARSVTVIQRSSRQLRRQSHYSSFVAAAAICYYCYYYLYALLFVRLPIVICIKSLIKLLPRSVASVGCTNSSSSSIHCCRVNRFKSLLSRDHLSTCTN